MAALRGILHGNRGEVSRLGSKRSGILAQVNTWKRQIVISMSADGSARIMVGGLHSGSGAITYEVPAGEGPAELTRAR